MKRTAVAGLKTGAATLVNGKQTLRGWVSELSPAKLVFRYIFGGKPQLQILDPRRVSYDPNNNILKVY